MEFENKLDILLEEIAKLEEELRFVQDSNPITGKASGKIRRLSERLDRIKILKHRISRLGVRSNIIRVYGKIIRGSSSDVNFAQKFELYYTDISEYDARKLARMKLNQPLEGTYIAELKSEHVLVGEPILKGYL